MEREGTFSSEKHSGGVKQAVELIVPPPSCISGRAKDAQHLRDGLLVNHAPKEQASGCTCTRSQWKEFALSLVLMIQTKLECRYWGIQAVHSVSEEGSLCTEAFLAPHACWQVCKQTSVLWPGRSNVVVLRPGTLLVSLHLDLLKMNGWWVLCSKTFPVCFYKEPFK